MSMSLRSVTYILLPKTPKPLIINIMILNVDYIKLFYHSMY